MQCQCVVNCVVIVVLYCIHWWIFSGETVSVESDPDVAGPKVPDAVKKEKEEPIKKKKRITLTEDEKETSFLLITNLTRPFTVNSFKEMLKRTGTIDDFWIDR